MIFRVAKMSCSDLQEQIRGFRHAQGKTYYLYKHKKKRLSSYLRNRDDKLMKALGFRFKRAFVVKNETAKPHLRVIK